MISVSTTCLRTPPKKKINPYIALIRRMCFNFFWGGSLKKRIVYAGSCMWGEPKVELDVKDGDLIAPGSAKALNPSGFRV